METKKDSFSELLCEENIDTAVQYEDDFTFCGFDFVTVNQEDEDYLQLIIQKELEFNFNNSGFHSEWVQSARLEIVSWIFKSREMFGFRLPTIYSSIFYLDQFISKIQIDKEELWSVKLLSVACLLIAAKMEEINVPKLTNFQARVDLDYRFGSKEIKRMELLVLYTLGWKMLSITPFPFLHYFFIKFFNNVDKILVSRTLGFILALIREINLMGYRPSVIAAAATLMALDQSLTRKELDSRVNSISSAVIETEKVLECYNIIKQLEIGEIERCSSIGAKRKRS